MTVKITVLNRSTVLSDDDIADAVEALQIQVHRDFAPAWAVDADVSFVPSSQQPDPQAWQIVVADNSDTPGALGYHDLTPAGLPVGYVFAKDDLDAGTSWTVTLSHELIEILADPWIDDVTLVDNGDGTGTLYAAEVCFTEDTMIPLLDGMAVPIRDLIGKDHFWVYSLAEDGSLRPGRGHSAKLTGKDAEIVKVTLDSGASIRCTADHHFMMRDGSYRRANELFPSDSLMPLYRRLAPMEGNGYEYEQTYSPKDDKWVFTHRFVEGRCPKGYVRHHKDFDRFNNSPENIELKTWEEHQATHRLHFPPPMSPERLAECSHRFKKLNASHKGKKRQELCVPHTLTQEQRAACGKRGRSSMIAYNKSEAHRQVARNSNRFRKLWENQEFRKRKNGMSSVQMRAFNATQKHRDIMAIVLSSPEFKAAASRNALEVNHKRWHIARRIVKQNCNLCAPAVVNHKIVSIEPAGRADVYDFVVEKYRNFALSAGVFVHNCDMCEDDSLGYTIRTSKGTDILVSDFCYPAAFEQYPAPGAQFDQQGRMTKPFQVLAGGYIGAQNVQLSGWTQINAQGATNRAAQQAPVHSRRERRSVGRKNWTT